MLEAAKVALVKGRDLVGFQLYFIFKLVVPTHTDSLILKGIYRSVHKFQCPESTFCERKVQKKNLQQPKIVDFVMAACNDCVFNPTHTVIQWCFCDFLCT